MLAIQHCWVRRQTVSATSSTEASGKINATRAVLRRRLHGFEGERLAFLHNGCRYFATLVPRSLTDPASFCCDQNRGRKDRHVRFIKCIVGIGSDDTNAVLH
jgi:hypothetical protein